MRQSNRVVELARAVYHLMNWSDPRGPLVFEDVSRQDFASF